MSNPVPSQLSLTSIADGSSITASPHRNNYTAIQAAVNEIIVALSNGTAGQFLQAVDGSDVQWGNAADKSSASVQAFAGGVSVTGSISAQPNIGLTVSNGLTINSGTLTAGSLTATQTTGATVAHGLTLSSGVLAVPRTDPTYGPTVTIDLSLGTLQSVIITDVNAFTISNPVNGPSSSQTGQFFLELVNNSGGANGAITFGNQYLLAGSPAVPNGNHRLFHFVWNGGNWINLVTSANY